MHRRILLFSLFLFMVLAFAVLLVGSVPLPPAEVWAALTGHGYASEAVRFIVMESRLPQMLTASLSGAALAVAGLVMQTVFRNPLADPSLLGVNAGAGLGAAVAMLLMGGSVVAGAFQLGGFLLTVCAALVGALAVIMLLVACSSFLRSGVSLLIVGVMFSFIASSVVSLLSFYATAEGVRSYVIWGLGDFAAVSSQRLVAYAVTVVGGLLAVFLMVKPLNALLLGDDYAAALGQRVRWVRTCLLLATGLLAAVVTALCGPISFIGLAVPHLARLCCQTANHRVLLPATAMLGASVALLCLLVSHWPGLPGTLPVNALTPLLGAPVVLWLILRGNSYCG